jgi:predicted Zn finger-like uncharacterized protein
MRITCPSCKAQYEIDDGLLPEDGREVQCSACGTVWFQDHPLILTERSPAPVAPPEASAEAASDAGDEPSPEEAEAPAGEARAKPVDEQVLEILRAEAAFEAEQRAREAGGLETQPDLGLAGAAPWPSDPAPEEPAENPKAARSTEPKAPPFPDIEDISASLEPIRNGRPRRGRTPEAVAVPPTSAERSSSFIRGLTLPLAVALILVALYLAAPMIGGAVPALAPVTEGYVGAVDGLRGTVAGLLGL